MIKIFKKTTGRNIGMFIYMIIVILLLGAIIVGISESLIERIQDEKAEKTLTEQAFTIKTQNFERVFTEDGKFFYIVDLIDEINEELLTIKIPKEKVNIKSNIEIEKEIYSDLNVSFFEKTNKITKRNNEFPKKLIEYFGSYGKIQTIKLYNK